MRDEALESRAVAFGHLAGPARAVRGQECDLASAHPQAGTEAPEYVIADARFHPVRENLAVFVVGLVDDLGIEMDTVPDAGQQAVPPDIDLVVVRFIGREAEALQSATGDHLDKTGGRSGKLQEEGGSVDKRRASRSRLAPPLRFENGFVQRIDGLLELHRSPPLPRCGA